MPNFIARTLTHRAASHAKRQGWLDVRYGFELLRNPAVPIGRKLLALTLGFFLTLLLDALELPLELVLGTLLPFVGLGLDFAIDGIELVALPFVFGAIILTWIERRIK